MAVYQDLLATRLEGLRRSLQLADRVLSGNHEVTLTFNQTGNDPAVSIGSDIYINLNWILDPGSNGGLIHILGLNYHEVGHVRYGCDFKTLESFIGLTTRSPQFESAWNILEEPRIETLLAVRYAKLKKYFTYPVVQHFVKDKKQWDNAFLFTHGRRYLPRKIRDTFRDHFEKKYGALATAEFAEVIDEYRTLTMTDRYSQRKGADCVQRFGKLLENYIPNQSPPHTDQYRKTAKPKLQVAQKIQEESREEEEQAKQETEQQDRREKRGEDGSKPPEQEEGEDDAGEGEDEPGSGDSQSPDEGESDGAGGRQDSQESGEDSDTGTGDSAGDADGGGGDGADTERGGQSGGGDSVADEHDPSSDGGGAGGPSGRDESSDQGNRSAHVAEDDRDLTNALKEALREILRDEQVQADISSLNEVMDGSTGLSSSLRRHGRDTYDNLAPVTPEMLAESERVRDELRKLWAQMEPGWQYGLSEGTRIDMNRAALAQEPDDYDSLYVDWSEGQQDSSGLELIILVDESGSMGLGNTKYVGKQWINNIELASRHVWEIMYAMQEIEASITVLGYETSCWTLYDNTDTVSTKGFAKLTARGGTDPRMAVKEARRLLMLSEMKNKALVVISDGDWPRIADSDFGDLSDVVKLCILIGPTEFRYRHLFDVVERTDGPIFEAMAKVVVQLIERNLVK